MTDTQLWLAFAIGWHAATALKTRWPKTSGEDLQLETQLRGAAKALRLAAEKAATAAKKNILPAPAGRPTKIPVNFDIEQSEARQYAPFGGSMWRGLQDGRWCSKLTPYRRWSVSL